MNEGKLDGYTLTAKMIRTRGLVYLSATEQALYYELMNICNRKSWQTTFNCSNWELCNALNIADNTLHKARSTLIECKLIAYASGKNRKGFGLYSFCNSIIEANQLNPKREQASSNLRNKMNIVFRTEDLSKAQDADNNNSGQEVSQVDEVSTAIEEVNFERRNIMDETAYSPLTATSSSFQSSTSSANNADYYKQLNKKTKTINNIFSENKFSGQEKPDYLSFSSFPIPEIKKQQQEKKPAHPSYQPMLAFWINEFHPGFLFTAANGRQLNTIIKKIEALIKSFNQETTPENIIIHFRFICENLPIWYKDKDLHLIDSGFNEIVSEIKNRTYGTRQHQAAGSRYNAAAKFFR